MKLTLAMLSVLAISASAWAHDEHLRLIMGLRRGLVFTPEACRSA